MHGRMAWQSLQTFCHIDECVHRVIRLVHSTQFRIHGKRLIDGDVQFVWNVLRNRITEIVRQIHHTPHIADDSARSQRTECDDLRHAVLTVFPDYIVNDLTSSLIAEININIRHRDTLRI